MAESFAIIGAGISGITVGNILLDTYPDATVTIYADKTDDIVSYVAIAQFYPIWFGDKVPAGYEEKAKTWILKGKEEFTKRIGETYGVLPKVNYELFKEETKPPAYFYEVLSGFGEHSDPNLPLDYSYYYKFDTMVIDTSVYIPQLLKDFLNKGGKLVHRKFQTVDEIVQLSEQIIFNCTGLASRELFGDPELKPVKGHVISMKPLDIGGNLVSTDEFLIAERTNDLCIGCLFDESFTTEDPTKDEQDYLFDHIKNIVETPGQSFSIPTGSLQKENIIKSVAGLRPVRETGVRVERELINGKTIVHNYGHGGSGVIFSWGTAYEAVNLL